MVRLKDKPSNKNSVDFLDKCSYWIFDQIWYHHLEYSESLYSGWIKVNGNMYWVKMDFHPYLNPLYDPSSINQPSKNIRDLVYEADKLDYGIKLVISSYSMFGLNQTKQIEIPVRTITEIDNY